MIQYMDRRLLQILRNNMTDPRDRGTTTTETISADGTNSITLSNKGLKNVSYVKNTTDGITLTPFDEWRKNFDNPNDDSDYPSIEFRTVPDNGDSIEVKYHYGGTWVYPSYPLETATYPRISVVKEDSAKDGGYLGDDFSSSDKSSSSDITYEIQLWVKRGNSYTIGGEYYSGGKLLAYLGDELESLINDKKSNLKDWSFRTSNWSYDGFIKYVYKEGLLRISQEGSDFLRLAYRYRLRLDEIT